VCTFALDLHLGPGKYDIGAWLYHSDGDQIYRCYDTCMLDQMLVVSAPRDINGIANLHAVFTVGAASEHDEAASLMPQATAARADV
jgi:hypothetical protein